MNAGSGHEGRRTGPVLYIEDNFHNRRLVGKILASRGIRLIEAEDGLAGLRLLRQERPAVVLLDISLPDIDGLEVLARIRGDAALGRTPVIALTASAMRGDRERFLEQGCDDYLSKPLQALELIAMVERYLEG
jgi:two-component system cell cycle response regulator DivK